MRSIAGTFFNKLCCVFLSLSLALPSSALAQLMPVVPLTAPSAKIGLTAAYHPAVLNSVAVHPENPFLFDFLVSCGRR